MRITRFFTPAPPVLHRAGTREAHELRTLRGSIILPRAELPHRIVPLPEQHRPNPDSSKGRGSMSPADVARSTKRTPEALYLDLMKKALSFALWPEPAVPTDTYISASRPVQRFFLSAVSRILGRRNLRLVRTVTPDQREEGKIRPAYAHTMIGLKRLDNLQFCVETALQDGVEGDLIETGVWRGGACIFMRAVLAAHRVEDRSVYVADSFAGLPEPDAERFPADEGDRHHVHTALAISQDEVADNFRKYGLLDEQVVFLKGWFKDTLPDAPMDRLAVLRLDGDMYGSTIDALTHLYPKLSSGGFCIVDDYALHGCRKAVDDYREQNGIRAEMHDVDWTGRYWRKE